jgi:hypothetical protein
MIRVVHPGSGSRGKKRHRIPDPQHWVGRALSLGKNVDAALSQTCTSEPTRRSRWCVPSARCGSACGSASRNMSKFTGEPRAVCDFPPPSRQPSATSDTDSLAAASFHVTKRKDYFIYGNSKFCGNNVVKPLCRLKSLEAHTTVSHM